MDDRTKGLLLMILGFTVLFGGLGAFGYLMYSARDQHPLCPCEMVKNHECVPMSCPLPERQ